MVALTDPQKQARRRFSGSDHDTQSKQKGLEIRFSCFFMLVNSRQDRGGPPASDHDELNSSGTVRMLALFFSCFPSRPCFGFIVNRIATGWVAGLA